MRVASFAWAGPAVAGGHDVETLDSFQSGHIVEGFNGTRKGAVITATAHAAEVAGHEGWAAVTIQGTAGTESCHSSPSRHRNLCAPLLQSICMQASACTADGDMHIHKATHLHARIHSGGLEQRNLRAKHFGRDQLCLPADAGNSNAVVPACCNDTCHVCACRDQCDVKGAHRQ